MTVETGTALTAATVLSAICYNLGGRGAPYNTKVRDVCCALLVTLSVYLVGGRSYWMALSALLLFGALTTYWKKGPKAYWYHWLFTGLGYSLAWAPFCYFNGSLFGLLCYTIVVSTFTTVWSSLVDNDKWEERGRGAIIVACAPLLMWRL